MSSPSFRVVAASIFGVVALVHATRLVRSLPVTVGSTAIPEWVSWPGLVVTGALSAWGFRSKS